GTDLHDWAIRPPHELELVHHFPDPDTGHEAELRIERGAQVEVLRRVIQVATVAHHLGVETRPRRTGGARVARVGRDHLAGEDPRLAQAEARVGRGNRIRAARELPVA